MINRAMRVKQTYAFCVNQVILPSKPVVLAPYSQYSSDAESGKSNQKLARGEPFVLPTSKVRLYSSETKLVCLRGSST